MQLPPLFHEHVARIEKTLKMLPAIETALKRLEALGDSIDSKAQKLSKAAQDALKFCDQKQEDADPESMLLSFIQTQEANQKLLSLLEHERSEEGVPPHFPCGPGGPSPSVSCNNSASASSSSSTSASCSSSATEKGGPNLSYRPSSPAGYVSPPDASSTSSASSSDRISQISNQLHPPSPSVYNNNSASAGSSSFATASSSPSASSSRSPTNHKNAEKGKTAPTVVEKYT